jgi:hypothetical protein
VYFRTGIYESGFGLCPQDLWPLKISGLGNEACLGCLAIQSFNVSQILAVDRTLLIERDGIVSTSLLHEVEDGLRLLLAL